MKIGIFSEKEYISCFLILVALFPYISFFFYQTIVKLASSIGTVVPVALSIVPYFYQVYTGNFERTIEVYGAPAMLAGSINSIIWLTYSIMASKKDLNLALILMHALLCMSTFTYLMCICACKRATKEVCFLFILLFVNHFM